MASGKSKEKILGSRANSQERRMDMEYTAVGISSKDSNISYAATIRVDRVKWHNESRNRLELHYAGIYIGDVWMDAVEISLGLEEIAKISGIELGEKGKVEGDGG